MPSRQGVAVSASPKNNPPSPCFCMVELIALMLQAGRDGYTPPVILAGQQLAARSVVAEFPMQGNGTLDEEAL